MQRLLTTGALLAAVLTPQVASADEAELQAMRAEIQAMQAKLDNLESADADRGATVELKSATDAAMADAEDRVNYQTDQFLAGHDGKKFFLESADGGFSLGFSAQIQSRYIYNHRESPDGTGIDDGENLSGFALRRVKLKGSGHIADPKLGYNITLAANRDSNNIFLEEVAIRYSFDNDVEVAVGRFKAPFTFDELTSSTRQQTVERSLVQELFTLGFVEGCSWRLTLSMTWASG